MFHRVGRVIQTHNQHVYMSLVISMTIYVCVVLSTNKRDKPDCLVVFVTELNWPVLNICTPSSFYTFENKMFGFVLP